MDRSATLLRGISKSMRGVEIGPFFAPLAPKSGGWQTIVVDFADGSELRAKAKTHGAAVIRSLAHQIEDVDVVWKGEPLDEICLPVSGGLLDYVLASHMIEHTPDIVSFFRQCSRMLKPEGVLSLAVPDLRKCFDLLKSATGTREALTAFRERRTRHTPETLLEARGYSVVRAGEGAWVTGTTAPLAFNGNFADAASMYRQDVAALSNDIPYVDAHAWHFTPSSFRLLLLELNLMGLTDLVIDFLEESPGSEFLTQLRRGKIDDSRQALEELRLSLAKGFHQELFAELSAAELTTDGAPAEIPTSGLEHFSTIRLAREIVRRVGRRVRRLLAPARS